MAYTKSIKHLTALILFLALALSASAALALPEEVAWKSTRRFLELMDEQQVKYTYEGLDAEKDEAVRVSYRMDEIIVPFRLYFAEDGEHCTICVWNLIAFDPADTEKLLREVNALNQLYRYCVFTVDEKDATVTASLSLIFRTAGADEICYEALRSMARIVDAGLDALLPYAKK